MLSLSMGMRQSLGVFMTPITADLSISVADFTLALAIQNIAWGCTQPIVGAYADRFGCRPVTMAGTLLYAVGIVATIYATGALTLILGTGILMGLALSCTSASLAMTAGARAASPLKRTMVLGIVSAAGSLGTVVAAPLAQNLIITAGWQIALVGFLGLCAVMLPASYYCGSVDRLPRWTGRGEATAEAMLTLRGVLDEAYRHRGYVTMALAFFVCGLQLVFLTTHLPTFLASCGQDPMLSAQALATIGAFNVGGCYLLGWLGDRFPKHVLLGIVYLLRSVAITAFFLLPVSPASTLIFSAVMGVLWLGVAPLVNGLVADIFGLRYMATLTGIAFFSHQVGSFLGAWGGGILYDALGSYDFAWQLGVAIGLIAGVAQMLMDVRPTPRMAAATA
jgi:MFS family permease